MAVLIDNRQRLIPVSIQLIRKDSLKLLRLLGIDERAELSVVLAAPSAMRRLNLRYRGVDEAADVLSFPQYASRGLLVKTIKNAGAKKSMNKISSGVAIAPLARKKASGQAAKRGFSSGVAIAPLALGDIVICPVKALEFAREAGLAPARATRTLLVHGFLHLLGYEHSRGAAKARRMRAKERELMKALG